MPEPSIRRAFWLGLRDALPFLLVIVPFGLLFGVLANEAGWRLLETLAMSAVVIAGASQFTALQLLTEHAPLVIAIAAPLAINLRMAMYSASLAPYLGRAPRWQRALMAYGLTDQTYGVVMNRYALSPKLSLREKVAHYFGTAGAGLRALVAGDLGRGGAGRRHPGGAGARLRGADHLHRALRAGAPDAAARRGGGGVGGGGPGAGVDAVEPVADLRGRGGDGDGLAGRAAAGAAAERLG